MQTSRQYPAASSRFDLSALLTHIASHSTIWSFCLFVLIPIAYVLISSFKTNEEINRVLSMPAVLNFENYVKVIENPLFISGLLNSLFITTSAMVIAVILSSLTGYAIGRARNSVFTIIYLFFLSSLMIPNVANMASLYGLMKNLNLLDSRLGLILVYAAGAIPFGVLLYAAFIKSVPVELDEAAMIDGCNFYQRYFGIILPLLRPAIVTHIVFSATAIWNDFFLPFLFITSDDKKTLPMAVYTFQSNRVTDYGPIFAMLVLAVIPLVLFFLLTQRYFYNAVSGAIKG
jgi:raffinose/stachyose/melibiose transport system permease protein